MWNFLNKYYYVFDCRNCLWSNAQHHAVWVGWSNCPLYHSSEAKSDVYILHLSPPVLDRQSCILSDTHRNFNAPENLSISSIVFWIILQIYLDVNIGARIFVLTFEWFKMNEMNSNTITKLRWKSFTAKIFFK